MHFTENTDDTIGCVLLIFVQVSSSWWSRVVSATVPLPALEQEGSIPTQYEQGCRLLEGPETQRQVGTAMPPPHFLIVPLWASLCTVVSSPVKRAQRLTGAQKPR